MPTVIPKVNPNPDYIRDGGVA